MPPGSLLLARRYTIIESDRFRTERTAISADVQFMDQQLFGVTTAISLNPEAGKATSNPDIWAVPTASWTQARPLVIYYSFDKQREIAILESIIQTAKPELP